MVNQTLAITVLLEFRVVQDELVDDGHRDDLNRHIAGGHTAVQSDSVLGDDVGEGEDPTSAVGDVEAIGD